MMVSFRHKGLKLLWTKNDASKLPAEQVKKIRNVLTILNSAEKVDDMNFPGSNLHALKGALKGCWSVTITGNYRVIFGFEDGNVHLIDYLDYH
jgi:toxin HigB-1